MSASPAEAGRGTASPARRLALDVAPRRFLDEPVRAGRDDDHQAAEEDEEQDRLLRAEPAADVVAGQAQRDELHQLQDEEVREVDRIGISPSQTSGRAPRTAETPPRFR